MISAQERRLSGPKAPEFAHDRHQLISVGTGAVHIQNIYGHWNVPAGCAVWIPAGTRHALAGVAGSVIRTLYIWRAPARPVRGTCTALAVSPLVTALVAHVCGVEKLRGDDVRARRLAAVLLDQVADLRALPLFVPAPRSPLTRRVAGLLESNPADTLRLRDLASEIGTSGRTLERAFVAETSMTIGEYRRRARIGHAITLLAGGADVKDVALEVGYETASAFVDAFKKMVGSTPGKVR